MNVIETTSTIAGTGLAWRAITVKWERTRP